MTDIGVLVSKLSVYGFDASIVITEFDGVLYGGL